MLFKKFFSIKVEAIKYVGIFSDTEADHAVRTFAQYKVKGEIRMQLLADS